MADQTNSKPWRAEVNELFARLAELCVENEVELDSFMGAAYSAYVDARPGLRDWLEEQQLRAQLDQVRQNGRMAEA